MPKGSMEMVTPTHTSEWLIQNRDLFSTRTCANLSHGHCLQTKFSLKLNSPQLQLRDQRNPWLFGFRPKLCFGPSRYLAIRLTSPSQAKRNGCLSTCSGYSPLQHHGSKTTKQSLLDDAGHWPQPGKKPSSEVAQAVHETQGQLVLSFSSWEGKHF